ncbi:MAG: hypothetical protein ACRDSZ_16805 [Pseudonocardiaceae bacterium]
MTQSSGQHPEITIGVNAANPLVEIDKVVTNTKDDILVITTSKAELVMTKHWKRIQQSNDWRAPLPFLIPITLALLTTNFATRFGVNDYVWRYLFLFAVALSAVWLVVQVIRRFAGGVMSAKRVVDLLLEDGKPMTAASSSAPTAPHAVSDTAHSQESTSPDQAAASSTTGPAHTDAHPSLSSPPRTSVAERRTQPAATSAGDSERTLTQEAAPHGVRTGDRMPELSAGAPVRHRNFGVGTVEEVLPGPPRLLLIRFADSDVGTKRLREDLAPLWHLGDEE